MILVVDSDPEVLISASGNPEQLAASGQVFLASNAAQALDIVEKLGQGLSVVLVDMDLPRAYDLIQRLHDANSELLFIAIRGAVKAPVLDATKLPGVAAVLNTPITSEWKPIVERVRARRFIS